MTEVLAGNVVAIPDRIASQHGIKPGSRLDWKESDRPDVLTVKILADYAAIASSLMGAGCAHLKPGTDPVGDLVQERAQEDAERQPYFRDLEERQADFAAQREVICSFRRRGLAVLPQGSLENSPPERSDPVEWSVEPGPSPGYPKPIFELQRAAARGGIFAINRS